MESKNVCLASFYSNSGFGNQANEKPKHTFDIHVLSPFYFLIPGFRKVLF